MAMVSTDNKRSIHGQDKTPTRRLIKKEGGRRPPSKMTRASPDDKRSIQRKDKTPTVIFN